MYVSSVKNIYARPGVSKIHGTGIIALRDIPKNVKIFPVVPVNGIWRKRKDLLKDNVHKNCIKFLQDYYCNSKDKSCQTVFCPDERTFYLPQNLINHSSQPNTTIIDGFIVSTQKIMEGEEIFENYIDVCGKHYLRNRNIII